MLHSLCSEHAYLRTVYICAPVSDIEKATHYILF